MNTSPRAAFGLAELIAVLAIIGILAAVVAPSLNTMVRGSQLTQAASVLTDELHLARQRALSRNRPVEVRFYRYEENGSDRFRSLQSFEIDESGRALPLGKIKDLPASITIDSGSTLTTLLKFEKSWNNLDPKLPLASKDTDYRCSAFRFLPDGSLNLTPAGDLWFLTMYPATEGDNLSQPPANFISLQIDTFNGHIRAFRP